MNKTTLGSDPGIDLAIDRVDAGLDTCDAREGDWIFTYSGSKFWPLDPRAAEIRIEDIAHALSNECRFGGHTPSFYSVAQHSVLVSEQCPIEDQLWGLLHDAAEAYLKDLPTPIKRHRISREYIHAEQRVRNCVVQRFGLLRSQPRSVSRADIQLSKTEIRQFFGRDCPDDGFTDFDPVPGLVIDPLPPPKAEELFLARYYGLIAIAERFSIDSSEFSVAGGD